MWEPLWSVLSMHYDSKATQGSKENRSPKMKSEFLQDVSGDLSVLLFFCTHFPKNLQPERTHLKCYTSCKNVQYTDFPFQYIISFSDSSRLCIFCFLIKVSTELIITLRVSLAFFSLIKYILKDFLMSRSENNITHGVILKVAQLSLKLCKQFSEWLMWCLHTSTPSASQTKPTILIVPVLFGLICTAIYLGQVHFLPWEF